MVPKACEYTLLGRHVFYLAHKLDVRRPWNADAIYRFLWVKLQLYELMEATTEHAVRETLQALPRSLEETYARMVSRIHRGPGGEAKIDNVRKVCRWIAAAYRPLKLTELEEAVALEKTDAFLHTDRIARNTGQRLIGDCGNLITHNAQDGTVRFIHHTAKQYICSPSVADPQCICINSVANQADIGEICLAYLSFTDFETQVAKTTDVPYIDTGVAEELAWQNVPLGGAVRNAWSWINYWRGVPTTDPRRRLRLAMPNAAHPSEVLSQRYTLLSYVVEFWAFHCSNFRPSHSAWQKFTHIALIKKLDFEFRPWTAPEHKQVSDNIFKGVRETPEWFVYAALYSWAFKHACSSLLIILEDGFLQHHVIAVLTSNQLSGFAGGELTSGVSSVIKMIASLPISTLELRQPPGSQQSSLDIWNNTLLIPALEGTIPDEIAAYVFLAAEFMKWLGDENLWLDALIDAANTVAYPTSDFHRATYGSRVLNCLGWYVQQQTVQSYYQLSVVIALMSHASYSDPYMWKTLINTHFVGEPTPADTWSLLFALSTSSTPVLSTVDRLACGISSVVRRLVRILCASVWTTSESLVLLRQTEFLSKHLTKVEEDSVVELWPLDRKQIPHGYEIAYSAIMKTRGHRMKYLVSQAKQGLTRDINLVGIHKATIASGIRV